MKKDNTSDIIYGIRSVMEAIHSGKEIDKVIVKKGLISELAQEFFSLLRTKGIIPQLVPAEKFNVYGNKNHQGVVAYVSPVDFQPIEELIARLWEEGKDPFIILLDSVTDVRNFGAIVRTAECAGAHAVVFPMKGSARIGSDAVKTSAGALHHMPICRVMSLKSTLSYLKLSGVRVVAATEKSSVNYTMANLKPPIAILLGSEDGGISESALKMADELVAIPIRGNVESLNVSVAAGLMMYESVRQQG
jgi:23S rRNA (guanosine2251-2'-O)-methyltransferase